MRNKYKKFDFFARKIPLANERSPTSSGGKNELARGGSLQDQASARGNSAIEAQSREDEENGVGRNDSRRGHDGGNPRVQRNSDLPVVQSQEERRGFVEMFPRFLL